MIRRQLELWKDWRPWLTLGAVVIPLGALLSLASQRAASSSSIPLFVYLSNWTPVFLESPGARGDLFRAILTLGSDCLILACWSWAAGFVVGSLSQLAIPVHGLLFYLAVWFAVLLPSRVGTGPLGPTFPHIVQWSLILLAPIWGMTQSRQAAVVAPSLRPLLLAMASVTVAVLVLRTWDLAVAAWGPLATCREWTLQPSGASCIAFDGQKPDLPVVPWRVWFNADRIVLLARQPPSIATLPLTLIGPIGYLAAAAFLRRKSTASPAV